MRLNHLSNLLGILALAFALSISPSAKADKPVIFQDTNFKLTVINALMEAGVLDFGFYPDFLKQIEGPDYDYENDGYQLSPKAYRYFADYPLTAEQLAKVEYLSFDGGLAIYPFMFPFWDGESDDFDIRSIADMRHLPNLKTFEMISMQVNPDLAPLRQTPNVQRLDLGLVPGSWQNLEALLSLPNLQAVTVFDTNITTPTQRAILNQLAARGVKVGVY